MGFGVSDGSGVGLAVEFFLEAMLFFFGEGSGVPFSFGDGEGVGVVFFLVVEVLRFFGGGVGSKNCFSFVPNDCSAPTGGGRLHTTSTAARRPMIARLQPPRRMAML